jgi:ABC-2 type transport system permease protein
MSFWRKMYGTARLAVVSQFEYRINLFVDAAIQPVIGSLIEMAMWYAIFSSLGKPTLAGYTREYYLVYALWASFFSRISANWMYEFRMIDEIESGKVNGLLLRPISFYEYYLGQYLGYKTLTGVLSFLIPITVCLLVSSPVQLLRLPLAVSLLFFYVIFIHTVSFCIASLGFFFNKIHSVTIAKNITIWLLSGEIFPLDLVPDPYKKILLWLPFSSGVFVPTGYLTGRLQVHDVLLGFRSVSIGIFISGAVAMVLWTQGRRVYSGTGA